MGDLQKRETLRRARGVTSEGQVWGGKGVPELWSARTTSPSGPGVHESKVEQGLSSQTPSPEAKQESWMRMEAVSESGTIHEYGKKRCLRGNRPLHNLLML